MKTKKTIKSRLSAFVILALAASASQATLVELAEYQDWEALQASIASEDVNETQADGMTALFWATYYDQTDVVRSLLNAGASANISNRYGMTPLIQAAKNGNGEVISMLLDAGADPNATTLEGDNAILNASKTGSVRGVQALIEAGANVNSMDGYLFQTPIMWAAAANQAAVVEILIDNGADIDTRSPVLELRGIRQGGVAGDFPDGGLTALHHAARENAIEATRVLIDRGANLDVLEPKYDVSPLRMAIINANLDLAKMLIESGANFNDGALVDLLDVVTNKMIFVRAEKNYLNQTSPVDLMGLMFDMGVDVDAYPEKSYPVVSTNFVGGGGTSGRTALFNAASHQNQEMVALLLEHGANPNSINDGGRQGGRFLPLTAALGLVQTGTELQERYAQEEGFNITESARLLIENGADFNAQADDGSTVLHHAVGLGNEDVVTYLIENGADLSLKDTSNRTALDLANGVPMVNQGDDEPAELPVYEEIATLLTEAMNAQGIAIEEYMAPESDSESGEA
jgi:ankyrin repeat protein